MPYGDLIKNAVTGKCIGTANNGSMALGTALVVWDCHGHPDQRWAMTQKELLVNTVGLKCASTSNGTLADGTEIVVGTCEEKHGRFWRINRLP